MDDLKFYSKVETVKDCLLIHQSLNAFTERCSENKSALNINKLNISYVVNDDPLKKLECVKNLEYHKTN